MDAKTLLILTVCLNIITFQSLLIIKADEALIKKLCDATSDPTVCTNCLKSDPRSAIATETDLVKVSLTCSGNDMDLLYQDTFRLQQNASGSTTMKEALNYCLDQVEDAKAKIEELWNKVQGKDFDGAKGVIDEGILAELGSCTNFIQSKGLSVPKIVSDEVASVVRDWKIVEEILGSIKYRVSRVMESA